MDFAFDFLIYFKCLVAIIAMAIVCSRWERKIEQDVQDSRDAEDLNNLPDGL